MIRGGFNLYATSSIYRRDPRIGQVVHRRNGHAPSVRAARKPGAVLVLKGDAARINAGLFERVSKAADVKGHG